MGVSIVMASWVFSPFMDGFCEGKASWKLMIFKATPYLCFTPAWDLWRTPNISTGFWISPLFHKIGARNIRNMGCSKRLDGFSDLKPQNDQEKEHLRSLILSDWWFQPLWKIKSATWYVPICHQTWQWKHRKHHHLQVSSLSSDVREKQQIRKDFPLIHCWVWLVEGVNHRGRPS